MLNIIYAGSPDVAVIPLKRLVEISQTTGLFRIAGILTNPPSMQGRSKTPVPTAVGSATEEIAASFGINIPVLTPEKLNQDARDAIQQLNPDLLVCFAYGKIFGPKFMSLFKFGGINLHPSLLPKYRGCAPVPAAILNQETITGVSVQKVALQMDSGDILSQVKINLDGTEDSQSLLVKSAEIGANQIADIVLKIAETQQIPEGKTQDESQAYYCTMLRKEDGLIDWNRSAKEIDAQIRAFNPWPGAFTYFNGLSLKIQEAYATESADIPSDNAVNGQVIGTEKGKGIYIKTGDGFLCVQRLQLQAKKSVNWNEFINGSRNFCGAILGKQD